MIVLDTHAWIWLCSEPSCLGRKARAALARERAKAVCAISCWEIAMLHAKGRIELDRDPVAWMEDALVAEDLDLLPLTPAIAVVSAQLARFHGDPADRLIVATALTHGARLVSRDEKLASSGLVEVLW